MSQSWKYIPIPLGQILFIIISQNSVSFQPHLKLQHFAYQSVYQAEAYESSAFTYVWRTFIWKASRMPMKISCKRGHSWSFNQNQTAQFIFFRGKQHAAWLYLGLWASSLAYCFFFWRRLWGNLIALFNDLKGDCVRCELASSPKY